MPLAKDTDEQQSSCRTDQSQDKSGSSRNTVLNDNVQDLGQNFENAITDTGAISDVRIQTGVAQSAPLLQPSSERLMPQVSAYSSTSADMTSLSATMRSSEEHSADNNVEDMVSETERNSSRDATDNISVKDSSDDSSSNRSYQDADAADHSADDSAIDVADAVTDIGPYDVLLGRGRGNMDQQGNVIFHNLILQHAFTYNNTTSRRIKNPIVNEIVTTITNQYNGRFLQPLTKSEKKWRPISYKTACVKASQALRYKHRKVSEKLSQAPQLPTTGSGDSSQQQTSSAYQHTQHHSPFSTTQQHSQLHQWQQPPYQQMEQTTSSSKSYQNAQYDISTTLTDSAHAYRHRYDGNVMPQHHGMRQSQANHLATQKPGMTVEQLHTDDWNRKRPASQQVWSQNVTKAQRDSPLGSAQRHIPTSASLPSPYSHLSLSPLPLQSPTLYNTAAQLQVDPNNRMTAPELLSRSLQHTTRIDGSKDVSLFDESMLNEVASASGYDIECLSSLEDSDGDSYEQLR